MIEWAAAISWGCRKAGCAEAEQFIHNFTDKHSASIKEYDYFAFTKIHKIRYW
ncbi:MAG: hypothetical protein NTW59_05470 [Candidatus Diapherotrites archaeon]|nr:hypothetical protein [Candidatus Diapherotrites archaeon]